MTREQRDQENAVMFGLAFAGDPPPRSEPTASRFQLPAGMILNRRNTIAELKAQLGRAIKE